MPESHRYYYLENKMNAESYKKLGKRVMVQNVYELICMVYRHIPAMKNSLIKAAMESFTCVKTIQKYFRIRLPRLVWNLISITIHILKSSFTI